MEIAQPKSPLPRKDWNLVIVANRGPLDFVWQDRMWHARQATSALSLMLGPLVHRPDVAWYCCVAEPPDAKLDRHSLFSLASSRSRPGVHIIPVPVAADVYHAYYGMTSNEVLWMLQHGLLGPGGYGVLDDEHVAAWPLGYLPTNRLLADAIIESVVSTRAFLIHDYHLYPLPGLIRRSFPDTPLLHFTHIPFPQPPTLRLLPHDWCESLLSGLLGADVVGFQTMADVRAFLTCCEEMLRTRLDRDTMSVQAIDGRRVRVRAFPASVDPLALRETMRSADAAITRARLAPHLSERTVIRVDRLDPSKNQLVGFFAFARLLEHKPSLRGRVRFLAFLVPSRTGLRSYRTYREAVFRVVEQINSRFADCCARPPIEIFYTNDRLQALVAMETCDVLVVNSRADGMNLVAKEWAIVSRRPGVLVVSETAGVANETIDSALHVSPLDVSGTSMALLTALDMSEAERAYRLARFRERVEKWTAKDWLRAQLAELRLV